MKNFLMQVLMGPIWLLALSLKPIYPDKHPWKNEELTLESWVHKGTNFSKYISANLWVCLVLILFMFFIV